MIKVNLLKSKLPAIESQTQIIYDAKLNIAYEGNYDHFSRKWNLYYEDDEVMIRATTKPDIEFGTKHLFLIGPL